MPDVDFILLSYLNLAFCTGGGTFRMKEGSDTIVSFVRLYQRKGDRWEEYRWEFELPIGLSAYLLLGLVESVPEVEAWLGARGKTDDDRYIGNGAFIVAALVAGFPIHRSEPGRSPNCSVGANRDDVRAVREGKDPREWRKTTAFVKWLFEQAGRGDPVGDLGEDCKSDFKFPRRGNVAELHSYLARYGDHIEEAFEAARREYRALP